MLSNATRSTYGLKRRILFFLIWFCIFLIVISLVGEILVRKYSGYKFGKPKNIPPPYNTAQKDDYLGWKMKPNYSFSGKLIDANGEEYKVDLNYDKNGFKSFGNITSEKKKILFLGDSYTASIEVSNEKSFFNLIRDSLDVEVFAYGHAGFGSLQEYLVFDKWVDVIKPDLVIWEVCSNDFIDNYAPLEIVCGYKVGERRPYLDESGGIYYRRPLSLWQRLKEKLHFYAWLELKWINTKKNVWRYEYRVGEFYISTEKRQFEKFDKAVQITDLIFQRIKKRCPLSTRIIGFSADSFSASNDEFELIFKKYELGFTLSPSRKVDSLSAEIGPKKLRSIDGWHWNELGHQVVANALIPFVRNDVRNKLYVREVEGD